MEVCIPPSYCIALSSVLAVCPAALPRSRRFTFSWKITPLSCSCLTLTGEERDEENEMDVGQNDGVGVEAEQSERRDKSKTDQKFREIKLNRRGKEGGKNDGEGKQIRPGQQARGKARHSSTPPLITTHNSERRLRWIKSRR